MCLRSDDPWLKEVTRKYSGPWIPETHDYGGRPITGYWAGIETAATRFVIHYDGDMFLYQEPGFDWAAHAIPFLKSQELALSASPRLTPPFAVADSGYGDYASTEEGMWMYPVPGGWKQYFFSTRAFVVDREKLERYLPLGRGPILREQMLVKDAAPRVPAVGGENVVDDDREGRRLSADALHRKGVDPAPELETGRVRCHWCPAIIDCVTANRVPEAQLGRPDLDLEAWTAFVK